jgi:GT2 family glycosyltransferase
MIEPTPRKRAGASAPALSVLVPTYGRSATIRGLLERLARQTLAPERFQVVVVDDGSPEPIELDRARYPFSLTLLRQDNAGPGAARNLGLAHCDAEWTLILNDDTVPADDLLEKHLAAAAVAPPRTAVLGTFGFTARALRSPFVQVLQGSDLLFDFPRLVDGGFHGWTFFWTCNLSLPTAALREIGGFDAERFREAIVEDVELGYRLAARGWRVLHRADLVAEHDHVLEPAGYFRRMVRLGANMARMHEKHGDPALLHLKPGIEPGPAFLNTIRAQVEALHGAHGKALEKLGALDRAQAGRTLPRELVEQVATLVRQIGTVAYWRGLLLELDGQDPFEALDRGPAENALTSIVVVSYDALAKTRKCVEALRAAADPRHPTELIFVDNGSRDGSAEWLAEQRDVTLIRNAANRGAPAARNQALARVRGEFVVVMDNDAIVSPGWLRRMLRHACADASSGCVGPVSDRAAHGQQVPFDGATDLASLAAHAEAWARANEGRSRIQNLLTTFCLLMRREVLDAIGGFDERFSPWGFEDDDFTLRSALAGFRNRVALDVFVRHEHYGDAAKSARHDELLRRNWSLFADKWGGPKDARYGDYAAVQGAFTRRFARAELRIPLPEPAAALPGREPERRAAPARTA